MVGGPIEKIVNITLMQKIAHMLILVMPSKFKLPTQPETPAVKIMVIQCE